MPVGCCISGKDHLYALLHCHQSMFVSCIISVTTALTCPLIVYANSIMAALNMVRSSGILLIPY
jgi:hypothetical protein